MSKRTRRLLLLIAVPLTVLAAAAAAGSLLSRPVEAVAETPEPKYILSGYDGLVAVFVPGEEKPSFVTETPVSVLPSADREALKVGMPVYSEEELTRLLEDYGT